MLKKLAVVVFLLGAVVLISAYALAEDAASSTNDSSASSTETATPAEEDTMLAEEGAGEGVVTGEITALDQTAGSITVKGVDGAEKAFIVVEGETILWKGIEDIKIADIKKGDKAEVGYYTNDTGKLVASWVDVIVPEQPASAAPAVPAAPASSKEKE